MTELQAAVALAGLPYFEQGMERRRRLAALYRQVLAESAGLGAQRPPAAVRSSWNGFALRIGPQAGVGREKVEQSLAAAGIETRRYYDPPLHRQKLYRRFYQPAREPLAATNAISSEVVSLPLHAGLEPQAVAKIARRIVALSRLGRERQSVPTAVCAG
jgi:dTDP-4-amino-4,6-dideoxygalactose transaminase